jgi:NADH-quinone oxidoreductase subunit F
LFGKPTTINNTQSLACVPKILQNGGPWFASLGPEHSAGTALFSVSGHIEKPGNYELPMGMPFKDLLELCGGVLGGRKLKAVIPGGSSCRVLPAEIIMGCTMDYTSLQEAGSSFGTGAVMVMDETTCMVKVLRRISRFYMAESCGQCTPCREGTGWMYRMLTRIVAGEGRPEDLEYLLDVANKIEGHTICALGDAAAWPVQSFLQHFFHEFEYMIENHGRSIVDGATVAAA